MNRQRTMSWPTTVTVAVAVAVAGISLAHADEPQSSPADARTRIERALSAFEFMPTRAALLNISPHAEKMLRDIAAGKTRRSLARNRALTSLRHFPGKDNEALLARVAGRACKRTDGPCRVDREQALCSYAVLAGDRAVKLIRRYLAHKEIDTRLAAARALRLSKSPRALTLLAQRLTVEKSATVRAEVKQEIQRIEGAEPRMPAVRRPGQ